MQTVIKSRPIRVDGKPEQGLKVDGRFTDHMLESLFRDGDLRPKPRINVRCARTAPDNRKFYAIAKTCPAIRSQVKNVRWNAAKQTVRLLLEEDGHFTAFGWFSTLSARRDEIQKSPFADLEQDALALCFLDSSEKEVARYKLVGLQLLDHACDLEAGHEAEAFRPLTHNILIQYDRVERLEPHRIEEPDLRDADEIADEEWSEVNLEVKEDDAYANVSL
jgi:hypothetical protein